MSQPVIFILLGPNLNMLGIREPHIYGHETIEDIEKMCRAEAQSYGFAVEFKQTNHEGDLVTWIQDALRKAQGIIINAAAYTHTSVAMYDALKMLENKVSIVEVHHSNPKEREPFRHISYVEPHAFAHFSGYGARGYIMGIEALAGRLGARKQ
ncbi:MAG TPA: 3-dehydroquinate dehydratase [Rhodospirillaceae bacterium]|nr:3-dehydroquinate dehydratase [Rhodospirillaceae bacterium]